MYWATIFLASAVAVAVLAFSGAAPQLRVLWQALFALLSLLALLSTIIGTHGVNYNPPSHALRFRQQAQHAGTRP